jgi:hypothetical protein
VIGRTEFPIHFKRHTVNGIDCVHADAALKAGARFLAEQPLHLDLSDQVFGAPVEMAEAVDGPPRQMGFGRHEVLMFGIPRQRVGHPDRVHGRPDDGMVHGIRHPLPQQIDPQVEFAETRLILLRCFHGHARTPPVLQKSFVLCLFCICQTD